MKIIISRTDNIGDVVLTLPMASILKQHTPNCEIYFLARNYVKEIVESCPAIDGFISWDELNKQNDDEAVQTLQKINCDSIIHVFPKKKIAKLAFKAKIKTRIGSSRRLYHWLYCNLRPNFSRKKSSLHEAQLNLQLIKHYGINPQMPLASIHQHMQLQSKPEWQSFTDQILSSDKFNLIIHPGSNGNGREYPQTQFISLINSLPAEKFQIFISGSQQEKQRFESLLDSCPQAKSLMGETSLDELTALIANADGLIASGTGPVHIAAAFGIKTLGLYPLKKSVAPPRWAPVGKQTEYLTTPLKTGCDKPCSNTDCECMREIEVASIKQKILSWLDK